MTRASQPPEEPGLVELSLRDTVDDIAHVYLASGLARALTTVVVAAGVSRERFLGAAGLTEAALDTPEGRLSGPQFVRVVDLAIDLTGDEMLGLRWANSLTEGMLVPVSHLVSHGSSLREGFRMLAEFYPLLSNHSGYALTAHDDDSISLKYLPVAGEPERLRRFSAEMAVGGFFRYMRMFDRTLGADAVRFAFPTPDAEQQKRYRRFFGGDVRFGHGFSGLVFDRRVLEAPSLQRDDDVRDALRHVASERLMRLREGTPWGERVRECMAGHGGPHRTDMGRVAQSLGISVRTLRRRLSDEGHTYEDIATRATSQLAMRLLRETDTPIQAIAFELGFASANTFHRAFKRWTGMTPKAYRESELRGPK